MIGLKYEKSYSPSNVTVLRKVPWGNGKAVKVGICFSFIVVINVSGDGS